jgi:cytochrome oxidase Cu insertion factor (SCO1/SenC/PrrC family)
VEALPRPITWLAVSLVPALLLIALVAAKVLAPTSAPTTRAPSGLQADIVISPRTSRAPDFSLRDQDNQLVSASGMRGRVLAITFLDSHCQQLCPIEGDQLAQVQRSLGPGSQLSLLVVSVAPTTDTPASERAFAAAHGWSGDWHWLVGGADQLAAVWKAYGIAVQVADNLVHSNVLYLIDRSGYERAAFVAGLQPSLVTHDIRLLAAPTN